MAYRVKVKPQLLTWAAERSGHSIDAYYDRFPKLEEWLSGTSDPTLKQLERFAKITYTSVGYFFLSEPPKESVPIPDFRRMAGSFSNEPSPNLLDTIYICQERQEWYSNFAASNQEPAPEFVGIATIKDDPKKIASHIRKRINFEADALKDISTWSDALRLLVEKIESTGVLVMSSGVALNNTRRPLDPEEFRGFAIADKFAPLIFINAADTKAAQMFTVVHEFAHLWLGQSGVSNSPPSSLDDSKIEQWCNQVAAETLVPIDSLRKIHKPDNPLSDEIQKIAKRFKVSTLVALRRVFDLGGMKTNEFWSEYKKELSRLLEIDNRKSSSGGNFYLTQAILVSKRFAKALVVSTIEGQTLYRDAYRMLGLTKHETFEKLGHSLGVI